MSIDRRIWSLGARAASLRDDIRAQWDELVSLGMTEAEVHSAFHAADQAYEAFNAAEYRAFEQRRPSSAKEVSDADRLNGGEG